MNFFIITLIFLFKNCSFDLTLASAIFKLCQHSNCGPFISLCYNAE